jgi:hypothetical protein
MMTKSETFSNKLMDAIINSMSIKGAAKCHNVASINKDQRV